MIALVTECPAKEEEIESINTRRVEMRHRENLTLDNNTAGEGSCRKIFPNVCFTNRSFNYLLAIRIARNSFEFSRALGSRPHFSSTLLFFFLSVSRNYVKCEFLGNYVTSQLTFEKPSRS